MGKVARVPSPTSTRQATLRRSVRLLREFRHEQSDPARFYTALADDSARQLAGYVDLEGRTLLDVGGGPGYFRDAFTAAGAHYLSLDSDVGELSGLGEIAPGTVIGSGMALPFRDAAVDVCYSSNVLEHVPRPWRMAEEMVRVTRPGGLVYLSYTVWFGPWGGHETAPWHFLGGHRARRRYLRTHGHEPKNKYGDSLFALTALYIFGGEVIASFVLPIIIGIFIGVYSSLFIAGPMLILFKLRPDMFDTDKEKTEAAKQAGAKA